MKAQDIDQPSIAAVANMWYAHIIDLSSWLFCFAIYWLLVAQLPSNLFSSKEVGFHRYCPRLDRALQVRVLKKLSLVIISEFTGALAGVEKCACNPGFLSST